MSETNMAEIIKLIYKISINILNESNKMINEIIDNGNGERYQYRTRKIYI